MRLLKILLLWTALYLQISGLAQAQSGSAVFVQVKKAKVRQEPRQWAKGIADVSFSEQLMQVANQDAWARVRTASGVEGYLHSSAITQRRVILSAATDVLLNAKVDDPDVYLAGKGFNEDVLKAFSAENPDIDFSAVEKMRSFSAIPGEELGNFLVAGGLQYAEDLP